MDRRAGARRPLLQGSRVAAIGIQALDLVGRRLALHGGRALPAFLAEVGRFCDENRGDDAMEPFTQALRNGSKDLQGRRCG